jgi:signal peptide peptidase SppA
LEKFQRFSSSRKISKMKTLSSKIWAGTEASLQASLEADLIVEANMKAGKFSPEDDEDDEENRLLEITEGIATISIKGSLNNDPDSWWNEMTGRTGYPEIRDALISAANNEAVKHILLDIDSGGGAVSGVADTSKLIRTINDKVKPITTYTEGTMASAAYWLGAAAGKVYAAESAIVGSIGVVATHIERSKAMEMDGYTPTVIRSGAYKALVNSVEPLSAEGKAQLQKMVDAANSVFVTNIAEMRNTPYATVDNVWGQGREFLGSEATTLGLTDGLKTFDGLMGEIKEKLIATSEDFMHNRGNQNGFVRSSVENTLNGDSQMSKKQALTAQDIAAIAAGAPIVSLEASVEGDGSGVALPEIKPEAAPVAEPAPAASTQVTPQISSEVEKMAMTVSLLTEQLATKDAALLQAGIKMAKLEESSKEALAMSGPMIEIVGQACNNMQIALGGSAIDLKGMGATQVLAEHQRLSAQFASKFKVGGVAAVGSAQTEKKETFVASNVTQAQLNALRGSN